MTIMIWRTMNIAFHQKRISLRLLHSRTKITHELTNTASTLTAIEPALAADNSKTDVHDKSKFGKNPRQSSDCHDKRKSTHGNLSAHCYTVRDVFGWGVVDGGGGNDACTTSSTRRLCLFLRSCRCYAVVGIGRREFTGIDY